jgi:hypothetical protein
LGYHFSGKIGGRYPILGVFQTWQCFVNLPLYSLGQNSRNDKYFQASITAWNPHLPANYGNPRPQEEALAIAGNFPSPLEFTPSTYYSAAKVCPNDSSLPLEIMRRNSLNDILLKHFLWPENRWEYSP